jgi:hypothetical protein
MRMNEPLKKDLFEKNENKDKLMRLMRSLSNLRQNLNVPTMKAYGRSVDPLIHNLGTGWRWLVSFMLQTVTPEKELPLPTE